MAIVLAVANQKGGCGKTTTVMNLAGGFVRAGYSVLVIDADLQASATMWSIGAGQGKIPFVVTPASHLNWRFSNLHEREDFGIVLIDCPPGAATDEDVSSKRARDAIRAADAVIVPIRPSSMDFLATSGFIRFLRSTARPKGQLVLALINGKQNNLIGRSAADTAARLFDSLPGGSVLETSIGLRTAITEVSGSSLTVFEYAPTSDACTEYTRLTKESIQCLAPLFLASVSSPISHSSTSPADAAP